jgi:branched-chain amino acid aminotransferase
MTPIPEMDTIWMDGRLVPWADAKIHVLTHALHYGSGVFEGIRAYKTERGAAVLRLTEHLKRLTRSAKLYYMPVPYSVEELYDATFEVLESNKLDAGYIRPLIFRGYGEMGLNPMSAPVQAVIAAWPWGTYLGEEGILHGVRAKTSSIQSLDHTALARAAKATGQYLNSILAKIEVLNAGYDEAVMLTEHGHVAEGSGENIFVVRNGVLMTPPPSDGVLEGITRDTVMRIAADEGIEARERTLARSDLVIAAWPWGAYLGEEGIKHGIRAKV